MACEAPESCTFPECSCDRKPMWQTADEQTDQEAPVE